MTIRKWLTVCTVFFAASLGIRPGTAEVTHRQVIIHSSPEDFQKIRGRFAMAIVDSRPGKFFGSEHLVSIPSAVSLGQIEALNPDGWIFASENTPVKLQRGAPRYLPDRLAPPPTSLGPFVQFNGAKVPVQYVDQPAALKLGLRDARNKATGKGVVVAVIDTGVDPLHPVLKNNLIAGRNYVGTSGYPSEWDDQVMQNLSSTTLDQSHASIFDLEQSHTSIFDLEQSHTSIFDLEQSKLSLMDLDSNAPLFGHGTMMAGLIHLTAPNALIMPMKAFDAAGNSTTWAITRAITDAADAGADIINMSFSSGIPSKAVAIASYYASSKGAVMVAASGNDNSESPTYPASFNWVVSVSGVTGGDYKASFSNYGKYLAIAAPGVDIVSTYPGGKFAITSGTSPATPLAGGVAALIWERNAGKDVVAKLLQSADNLKENRPPYKGKLGDGRTNAYRAVR